MYGDKIRVVRLTPTDDPRIAYAEGYISRYSLLLFWPFGGYAPVYVKFPDLDLSDNQNYRKDGSYLLYRNQIINLDSRIRRRYSE